MTSDEQKQGAGERRAISDQLSAISPQRSAISDQLSDVRVVRMRAVRIATPAPVRANNVKAARYIFMLTATEPLGGPLLSLTADRFLGSRSSLVTRHFFWQRGHQADPRPATIERRTRAPQVTHGSPVRP